MTPQQRLEEIADILADGFLRLLRRPGHVPEATLDCARDKQRLDETSPQVTTADRPHRPAENTSQDSQELPGGVAAASA